MPEITPPWRWIAASCTVGCAVILVVAIPYLGQESINLVSVRSVGKIAPVTTNGASSTQLPWTDSASPSGLTWTLPDGWTVIATKPMRLASLAINKDGIGGECGVFLFAGGGDRLANVNRWLGQVGLPPLDEAGLNKVVIQDTGTFGAFAWLPVRGPTKAFLAAIIPTPIGQCFVKLEAPGEQLDGMHDGFLVFCRSLRLEKSP